MMADTRFFETCAVRTYLVMANTGDTFTVPVAEGDDPALSCGPSDLVLGAVPNDTAMATVDAWLASADAQRTLAHIQRGFRQSASDETKSLAMETLMGFGDTLAEGCLKTERAEVEAYLDRVYDLASLEIEVELAGGAAHFAAHEQQIAWGHGVALPQGLLRHAVTRRLAQRPRLVAMAA